MSTEITDRQLLQLIQGELSHADECHLENLLSLDAELRARLDRLSGGDEWTIGSAPIPPIHQSERLSLAIERVSQYITEGVLHSETVSQSSWPSALPKLTGITLLREIGRGGMGVVYEGIDDALARRVAVKFIQPIRAASPEAQERLLREAKATAALHHDNIVTIHSIQTVDGVPALIGQFIDGPTLQEVLDAEGQLSIPRCLDLARQLTKGLAAAHAAGIVHRDLKPGNVLIEKQTGTARLADFGMAKHLADLHLSSTEVVSGTPAYMSPEQTRGEPTDVRSDLFSLGAILYTAVAGRTPFVGNDPFVLIEQVRSFQPPLLSSLRPESPAWLNSIIHKLLSKRPEDRIASAEELLQLLDTSSNFHSRSHGPRLALIAACSLIALATAVGFYLWPNASANKLSTTANDMSPAASVSPAIWIGDQNRSYDTLQSAIKDAVDDDVIYLAGDIATEQIDVIGKRLTIAAATGTRPSIRPTDWAIEHSPFLFRADRDFTIRGLHIDWPVKTEPLSEPGTTLSAIVAVIQSSATLLVEDCTLHRDEGICLASMGNLTVQRSRISGGKFALGWVANNSQLIVANSHIDCETGIVVIYPTASTPFRQTSTAQLQGCTFTGQGMLDFILFRHPEHPVEMIAEDCRFDVQRFVQLSGTTIVANLSWDLVAQSVAKSCLTWQERDCKHRAGIEYLASRRIRGANRWMLNDLRGLDAWLKFWTGKDHSTIENAREESF